MSCPPCISLRTTASRLLPALLLLAATSTQLPAQEKKAALPPELAVIPHDAVGFLYLRPAEVWNSEPAVKLRKLFPLQTLGLLKILDDDPAATESLIAVMPAQDGKAEKNGNRLSKIVFVETTVKPVSQEKVLQQLLGKGAVKKSRQKRSYYTAKDANGTMSGAIHFLNDRTYIFTFTAESMEQALAGLDRPSAAGPLSPAVELARQKRHAVLGLSSPRPIAETLAELLGDMGPTDFDLRGLTEDVIPDGAQLWNVKSAALSLDVNQVIRLEGELTYADERTAARAAPALQDIFTLLRLAPCPWLHGELRRKMQVSDDAQPLAFLDVLLSQAEGALRKPAVEQKQATVNFALSTQLDVDALYRAAELRAKNVAREDFAFVHARIAEMVKTELGAELLKLSPDTQMMTSLLVEMGLPLHEVESMTAVLPTSRSLQFGIGLPRQRQSPPRTEKVAPPVPGLDPLLDPLSPLPKKIDEEKKKLDEKFEDKKEFDKKSDGSAFHETQPGRVPRRVSFVEDDPLLDDVVMVLVKTTKPVDRARLLKFVLQPPSGVPMQMPGKNLPPPEKKPAPDRDPDKTEKKLERKYRGKTYYVRPDEMGGPAVHFVDERTVLFVSQGEFMPMALSRAKLFEAGELAQALESAQKKKHHLVVGLNLTESSFLGTKSLLREAMRGGPQRGFFDAAFFESLLPLMEARSLLLTADLGKEVRVQAEVGFANPEQAAAAVDAAEDGLAMARLFFLSSIRTDLNFEAQNIVLDDGDSGPIVFGSTILVPGEKPVLVPRRDLKPTFVTEAIIAQAETLLRKATFEQKGATLKVLAAGKVDTAGLIATARQNAAAFIKTQELELNMSKSIRNLSRIVAALQSYHDVHGKFPASGKLSWRVHLLPFMDELALYQEFKLDQAWDSRHNLKLLPRMPKVFASPGIKSKEPFTTPYQMFAGSGSLLDKRRKANDGGNWLALAEAEATAWTKPGELILDAKKPAPKLGGVFTQGFHVAFADGRIQLSSVAEAFLRPFVERRADEKKE